MMIMSKQVWLDARKAVIGGSEIAAIMGLDQYRTPLDVQRDKLGLAPPVQESGMMMLGNYLEPKVAEIFTEMTGYKCAHHPFHKAGGYNYVGGTPDRLYTIEDCAPSGVLEIKTTSPWVYRKIKMHGLPDSWILQLQYYLGIFNGTVGAFAVMDRNSGDVTTFEVQWDAPLSKQLMDFAEAWYKRHVIDQEPVIYKIPEQVELPAVGGEVERIDNRDWQDAVAAYRTAKEIADEAGALLDDSKGKLVKLMGAADVAEGCGVRVYYREQAGRKSVDYKAMLAEHPDIDVDKYTKRGQPFRSLRVFDVQERGE